MKQTIIAILLLVLSLSAKPFITVHGGVAWPHTLSTLENPVAGTAGLEWGIMAGNVFGIGGVFDAVFRKSSEDIQALQDTSIAGVFNTYLEETAVRRRQFSLGVGIQINPLDSAMFRPVVRAKVLPSMMILLNDYDTSDVEEVLPPTGVYWGINAEVGGDIHVMFSDEMSFFCGAGYRFGSVRKRINYNLWDSVLETNEDKEYIRQSMDGLTLRMGFQVW